MIRLIPFFLLTVLTAASVKGSAQPPGQAQGSLAREVTGMVKEEVIRAANAALTEEPRTVTASFCPRSSGGRHDYYSEGTYWWPDTARPGAPYIRRDGIRNPANFGEHEAALHHFSRTVANLTSAYLLTGDDRYVQAAMRQMNAWMVDTASLMNPDLLHSQAISGICTGRSFGIIDAVPLIEVALSLMALEKARAVNPEEIRPTREWFRRFTLWLNTHPYGTEEKEAKNNHGTWWLAQVSAYARLTGDIALLAECREIFTTKVLPAQMAADGSFPLELVRTKPFGYSLYNLDALAAAARILSDQSFDAWNFSLPDGRGLKKGLEFMMPFVKDVATWSYARDVAGWEALPGPRNFILLAALSENNAGWLTLWKSLAAKDLAGESRKALPLSIPIIWISLIDNKLNR